MSSYDNTKDLYLDREEEVSNSSFTAKGQTKVIDKTIGPDEDASRVISGDIQDANNATIVGGRDVINATGQSLQNATIYGDAVRLHGGTFTGGADKITLGSIDHANAIVVGDAINAQGGSFRGGNDTIIVEGDVNGGHIAGDVLNIQHANFIAGADNIQLKGNVVNASIFTDSNNTNPNDNTLSGGNDIVTLGIAPTKANPVVSTTVTNTQINLGHGNDNLTAHSTIGAGTDIDGHLGNDRFTIANMTGGSVSGGDGNDSINVTTSHSGRVYGGAGNDIITVKDYTGITSSDDIFGDDGNDKITVTTATDAHIDGGEGNDSITITTSSIGTNVYGGEGNDVINIKTFTGTESRGLLRGDGGNDKITVETANDAEINGNSGDDTIIVDNLNSGSIDGELDNDSITVTTATNASIWGGQGDDTITVTNLKGGELQGHVGENIIKVINASDNATIQTHGASTVNVTNLTESEVVGSNYVDNINIATVVDGTIDGRSGDDKINISKSATNSTIYGNHDDDSISIITANDSKVYGDYDSAGITGDDSIKITTANNSLVDGMSGEDSITIVNLSGDGINGQVDGGTDNDIINITTMTNAIISDAGGSDSVKIATLKGYDNDINLGDGHDSLTINNFTANKANVASANAINMGAGDDSLNILAKNTNYSDTEFVNSLGTGNDTLNVNWAFNGIFNTASSSDGKTLITKGLGADANLNFGSGDDALIMTSSSNKSIHQGDSGLVDAVNANGGNDTLQVNWAFNGDYWTGNDGGTLITKGLNANSTLDFGDGDDGFILTGALSNRSIATDSGNDTVSISGTATNVQVDLSGGADVFSVGAMGKNSTLHYDADDHDSITIKGTYNHGMVVDGIGEATSLSTGFDGGTIILDTLGTGKLSFGDSTDNLTINKNVAGTATVKKEINTLGGDDNIDLKGTVTHTIIDSATGADTVSIGAFGTGSLLTYDADGLDSITIKGTYNTGTTKTIVDIANFYGLSTGEDGGSITLDTLGTGKLQFGGGNDTLTINKALSGSLGLKDIFMQDGADSVILNTVNGAIISGGDGVDYISATGLGATGVLNGDAGADTIQIGREYTDAGSFKSTATMSNGTIDGGAGDDFIFIGNTLYERGYGNIDIKGTLNGGKVYGGDGDDAIVTNTLSGSGLMDGGLGVDALSAKNMSGGTMSGGADNDSMYINGTFSRGTINGGDGDDTIDLNFSETTSMSGGTINAGLGKDTITIQNFKGGVINTNDDTEADTVEIENMTGGTINSGLGDIINISNMNGGVINDSADNSGNIVVEETMTKGTINGNDGDDAISVVTMNGGTVNGQDGDDDLAVGTMNGGTFNAGEGHNSIEIADTLNGGSIIAGKGNDDISIDTISGGTINAGEGENNISISTGLNGGKIIAGKGDDTLTLEDGITIGSGYSIDLGAGENNIFIQSNLDGQRLSLGASSDWIYADNTDTQFINASINLGAGDDTLSSLSGGTRVNLINSLIDAGSGDDVLSLNEIENSIVLGGTGNDTTWVYAKVDNSTIDAGSGNNRISLYKSSLTSTNVSIVSGSGNDNLHIEQALNDGSSINVGTGSDDIYLGNTLLNADGTVGATISYDNKGQDSIRLQEYHAGMVIDSKGETTALSTGSDGGSIRIESWVSGDISFGNGNDSFTLNDNLVKSINLGSGADSVRVDSLQGDGAIIYNNSGFDTIDINGAYNGSGVYQSLDKDGKGIGTLSTGSDGGSITLGSWTGGMITLGNGNDAVAIQRGSIANNLDFMKGNDTITINELTQNYVIKYDNAGKDEIILDEYAGFGIEAQDGKLSTGASGGTITLNSITEAGVLNLSFSDSNDSFIIDDLDIVDDANIEGTNTTIDLKKGADSIEIDDIGASGAIKYNVDGADTIYIDDTYSGTGVYGYSLNKDGSENNLGLATGDDGGYIYIQGIDEAGAKNISFGKGADTLEVDSGGVDIGGESIDLGLGNDKVLLGWYDLKTGTINAGDGNNTIEISRVSIGSTVLAGSGADTIEIHDTMEGSIDAGNGNNKIIFNDTTTGNISTGTGADNITFNPDWQGNAINLSGSINAGLGNDSMNLLAVSGTVYGDANSITTTTNFSAGVDRITADSLSDTAKIYGDANSITATEKLSVKGGNDIITVNGDIDGTNANNVVSIFGDMESVNTAKTFTAGNDNITLKGNVDFAEIYTDVKTTTAITNALAGGNDILTLGVKGQEGQTSVTNTSINLGHGNDTLMAYSTLNSDTTIDAGTGNDRLTISEITAGTLNGDAGNDSFNIVNMIGGTANGGAGNDTFNIDTMSGSAIVNGEDGSDYFDIKSMAGGTVNGGASNDTFKLTTFTSGTAIGDAGNDKFNIITMNGGTVYGDDTGDDTTNMLSGNDIISVTTATGGTIVGGEAIETQNSKGVSSFGVDSIVVKNATDLVILGDYGDDTIVEKVDDTTVSYNDIIKVTGIAENTTIDGSYGNDNITVAIMNGGIVSGGDGNDTITISTSRDGGISGGDGDDKISVTTGIGDEVDGGFILDGGDGNDTISMTTLNRGEIKGGTGENLITVKNAYASRIFGHEYDQGDSKNATIKVTGLAEDTSIAGSVGDDTISVGTATAGSSIDGANGDDAITVTTLTNSTISGGGDDDTITAKTATSSLIYGDTGADSIVVTTANSSGVYGGDGNDTIKVTTLNSSSIDGGAGEDFITVTNQIKSTVYFNNAADMDEIYLQGGIGAGAIVNLNGAGGFTVSRDGTSLSNSVFNMSGGELNGSEGQDYLYLGTLSGGEINGNDSADDINIKTMSGGIVDGGAGNDSLIVNTNMTNGTIRGGAGDDSIDVKISGASKGILDGGAGADTFAINAAKNSSITIQELETTDILTINNEDATDAAKAALALGKQSFDFTTNSGIKVTVNFATVREQDEVTEVNITNKTIYGTDGIDTFNISGTATNSKIFALGEDDIITVGTLTNSEIYGEAGADNITITTVNGGRIDGGYDDDIISIKNQVKKSITIANEDGADTLYLEAGIGSGGNVTLENPGFVVAQGFDTATSEYTGFNLSAGTLTGSESVETIHINTMSSGTLNTLGGVDTINIASMTGGTITTTDASATINIDAAITKTVTINNFGGYADNLNLASGLNGGTIKLGGDGGFDIGRTVRFDMLKGTINGSAGSENVFIETMSAGTINTADGQDSIDIRTMQAGSINTGAGVDSITIKTLDSGTIDGGAGLDYINIFDDISSKVSFKNTGIEQDNLNLGNIVTGANITFTSNAGFRVQADEMQAGQITGSAGADDFLLSKMTAGEISLGAGNDSIRVGDMDDGNIDAGSGNDTVSVNEVNGIINGGSGFDMLQYIGTVDGDFVDLKGNTKGFEAYGFDNMDSGSINGTDSADDISILMNMRGGALNGNAGNDTLSVHTMLDGNVNGGAGNDVIEIEYMQSGTLDGGADLDSIEIENYVSSEVTITNTGSEVDVLTLSTGISSGGIVNLTGDNAFVVNIADTRGDGALNATGKNDSINIITMSGGTINGGAGDDNINVLSANGGTIDGGEGMDTINIINAVTNSFIVENSGTKDDVVLFGGGIKSGTATLTGDNGFDVAGATTESGAFIGFNMTGGTLATGNGNDNIYIASANNASINTGAGSDNVIFIEQAQGSVNLNVNDGSANKVTFMQGVGAGANIVITSDANSELALNESIGRLDITGGTITLNGQTETTVRINEMSAGSIIDNSTIAAQYAVNNMTGGTIETAAGIDSIRVGTLDSGSVYTADGNDTINIDNFNLGLINAAGGDDSLRITTMTGGDLHSWDGVDKITIGTMSGGSVTNTTGEDIITITDLKDGTINGGSDAETYDITNMSGATISGDAGADTFNIETMTGGTLNGGDDIDTFNITSMSGGTINGEAGADSFNIETMSGGSVNGGAGEDIFDITTALSGEVSFINNDAEQDSIIVAKDITQEGTHIILEGSGGFNLSFFDQVNYLNKVRITGSAGNDSIELGSLVETSIDAGDGDDTVTLHFMEDDSAIYGGNGNDSIYSRTVSNSMINGGDGNDTIEIEDGLLSGSTIDGGAGDDSIAIGLYSIGVVDGGTGNDTISIESVRGDVNIHNSGGHDTLILTSSLVDSDSFEHTLTLEDENITLESSAGVAYVHTAGTIAMGAELTNLELGTVDGGNVTGNDLDNKITITTMQDGTIDAGAGNDYVIIDSINGTINGGDGEDTLHITSPVDGELSVEDILSQVQGFEHVVFGEVTTNGKVSGTDVADSIGVVTMTDGLVSTLAGNDAISISNFNGGSIDGGVGQDSVHIENTLANGVNINNVNDETDYIYLENGLSDGAALTLSGNGNFIVTGPRETMLNGFDMSGGIINGGGGREEYYIKTLSGGTINADTIGVQSYVPAVPGDGWVEDPGNANAYIHAAYGTIQLDDNGQYFYTPAVTITEATSFSIAYTINYTDGTVYNGNLTINVDPADLSWQNGTVEGFLQYADEINIDTMIDGTVNAGDEGDLIEINTMQGGIVDGGKGWDFITINNQIVHEVTFKNSSDNFGFEADELFLTNGIGNGGIVNLDTTEGFVVSKSLAADPNDHIGFNMSGGVLNGSTASDWIYMDKFSGGTVNGANGSDMINIVTAQGGTINSGAGADTIYVNNEVTASLTINNGMDTIDHLFLENGIGGGANIRLEGSNGFIVAAEYDSVISDYVGFNMSGGALTTSSAGFNDKVYINTMSAGNIDLSGGQDTININTMTNGNVQAGFGSDSITITNMNGGTINSGYSGDKIFITNFNGGTINTDDATVNNNDIVIVQNQITKTVTFSHKDHVSDIHLEGGVGAGANITLHSASSSSVFNVSGAGTGFDMSGGTINGSDNYDSFVIAEMSAGTIYGNAGSDSVDIDLMSGNAIIDLGDDVDGITVMDMQGNSKILGGGSGDRITINGSMSKNAVIDAGADDDVVHVQDLTIEGTINGGDGRDTLVVTQTINSAFNMADIGSNFKNFEVVQFNNLESSGSIIGTANDDSIHVSDLYGAINGDAGSDSITFYNLFGGSIYGGAGDDTIGITSSSIVHSGYLDGGDGNDVFYAMITSDTRLVTLNGGAGDDVFNIMGAGIDPSNNVILYGGAGADIFDINSNLSITSLTIAGFEAGDILKVDGVDVSAEALTGGTQTWGNATITFADVLADEITGAQTIDNTDAEPKYLYLNGGVGTGADLTLSGAGGFVLNSTTSAGFNMTAGDITGSAGADYFIIDSMSGGKIYTGAGVDTISIAQTITAAVDFSNSGAEQDIILLKGGVNVAANIYVSFGGNNVVAASYTDSNNYTGFDLISGYLYGGSGGVDIFYIDTMTDGHINGWGGSDEYHVATMNGGWLRASSSVGDLDGDLFNIETMNAGSIFGYDGNDTVNIISLNGGEIGTNKGDDSISVNINATTNGATLEGGEGADTYSITSTEVSEIDIIGFSTADGDKLFVNGTEVTSEAQGPSSTWDDITINFIGERINEGSEITTAKTYTNNGLGADIIQFRSGVGTGADITLEGTGGFEISAYYPFGFNMTDGDIFASEGVDVFYIDTMSGGYISGGAGADQFHIDTVSSGTVIGQEGVDEFHVTTLNGGQLTASNSSGDLDGDLFEIGTMNAGIIGGFDGNDTVNVTSMHGGSIRTRAGDDSITVDLKDSINSGRLEGGEGADTYTITSSQEAGVEIIGFNTSEDTLIVGGVDVTAEVSGSEHTWGDITIYFTS